MNWRLFVGLALPESTHAALTAICHGLPGIRWQKPANLHVTLKFMGLTDDLGFARIDDALKSLAPSESPVPIRIEGVGIFGDPRRVRALWAGVVPNPALTGLQFRVESALAEKADFAPEGRPYRPHVTLAKPGKVPADLLKTYLEKHADMRLEEFTTNEAILFSSHGSSGGSEYRVERNYLLGAS